MQGANGYCFHYLSTHVTHHFLFVIEFAEASKQKVYIDVG